MTIKVTKFKEKFTDTYSVTVKDGKDKYQLTVENPLSAKPNVTLIDWEEYGYATCTVVHACLKAYLVKWSAKQRKQSAKAAGEAQEAVAAIDARKAKGRKKPIAARSRTTRYKNSVLAGA